MKTLLNKTAQKPVVKRRSHPLAKFLVLGLAALACATSQPATAALPEVSGDYAIQLIDPPNDATAIWWTFINERGTLVMQYETETPEGNAQGHTAILENGMWKVIDVPGSAWCGASYPNASDRVGLVYALEGDDSGYMHNAIYHRGTYTLVPDHPEWQYAIQEINDHGIMTGFAFTEEVWDEIGSHWVGDHGLLLNASLSLFQVFDPPGSIETIPFGVNNAGFIVGWYWNEENVEHGFFSNSGKTFKDIDVPGASTTFPAHINNKGEVAGPFTDSDGVFHGFLLRSSTFETFNIPGAQWTSLDVITDKGQLSGECVDADGNLHGYIATRIAGRK
jgi:hypothetical protein